MKKQLSVKRDVSEKPRGFCEFCARKAFKKWKGWPKPSPSKRSALDRERTELPALPIISDEKCPDCGNVKILHHRKIFYKNIHGSFSTGLPDYFILEIADSFDEAREFQKKFGYPYPDLNHYLSRLSSNQKNDMPVSKKDLSAIYSSIVYTVGRLDSVKFTLKNQEAFTKFCRKSGFKTAALIIADNPKGRIQSEGQNMMARRKMDELLNNAFPEVDRLIVTAKGKGEWPDERGLLFTGVSKAEAKLIGRIFQQLALVFWTKDQGAKLVWL